MAVHISEEQLQEEIVRDKARGLARLKGFMRDMEAIGFRVSVDMENNSREIVMRCIHISEPKETTIKEVGSLDPRRAGKKMPVDRAIREGAELRKGPEAKDRKRMGELRDGAPAAEKSEESNLEVGAADGSDLDNPPALP